MSGATKTQLIRLFTIMGVICCCEACSSYTTWHTMKPTYDRENFGGVYVDAICVSKRDIYGILIPVIPITTNFADSAFVRLSSSTPFHKCPDVQDSEGHVFVGELRKGNSCVYEAKPDTAATLFFISGDFKREWK